MSRPAAPTAARLAAALGTFAALAAFAAGGAGAPGGAESAYLALLAAAVLLPLAALEPPPAVFLPGAAVIAATAAWALPAGPTRGAAVCSLLALALLGAAFRGLSARPALPWALAVPAALGFQALFRAADWLDPAPDLPTLASLVGLPLAAGAALAVLGRRHPGGAALAGATLLAWGPGWRTGATLTLLALAAAEAARERSLPLWARGLPGALVLGAAFLWRPAFGLLLSLALPLATLPASRRVGGVVTLAAAGCLALLPAARPWPAVGEGLAWLLLLLPSLPLAGRAALGPAPGAVLLGAAGLRSLPGAEALVIPLALLALRLPEEGEEATFQRLWTGTLLGTSAVLAAYPWLRPRPLEGTLELLGLAPGWVPALLVAAALLALRSALRAPALRPAPGRSGRAAGAALAALFLAAWAALPGPGATPLPPEGAVLDAGRPTQGWELPGVQVGAVVLDSHLAHAAGLPPGTPVATLRLAGAGGAERAWVLRAGRETGEWAVRRPDLARAGVAAPDPWVSWVAAEGFFGQRYRSRRRLEPPLEAVRLEIRRDPDLPEAVALAVARVELRP